VAFGAAAAAIKKLLGNIDGEAVMAAAFRTWPAAIDLTE
jgi:hypothetical protein